MKRFNIFKRPIMGKFALLLAGVMVVLSGCQDDPQVSPDNQAASQQVEEGLIEVLENWDEVIESSEQGTEEGRFFRRRPTFHTLVAALIKTNLLGTVLTGEITVFAPTDRAFAQLGLNAHNVGEVENLEQILLYHVLGGRIFSRQFENGFVPTVNEAAVEVKIERRRIFVNNARVIRANRRTFRGVIHVINEVLIPPTENLVEKAVGLAPEFTTLVDAVVAAGLAETLATGGPFTVFAPTNQAFADLGVDLSTLTPEQIANILLYHVVPGRVFSSDLTNGDVATLNGNVTVSVNDLTIDDLGAEGVANLIPSLLNVQATNGVIHVIDKVLIPAAE